MRGHWFCDNCYEVVFIPGVGRPDEVERCPACHKLAASFVPDAPEPRRKPAARHVTAERGREWLAAIRKHVESI